MASEGDFNHIQKLKNVETFPMWEFELTVLFKARELMDIVDGSDSLDDQKNNETNIKKWKAKDAKAQYYILLTIDKEIKPHILTCKNSQEMFKTLKGLFQKETATQKCVILKDFYNYRYNNEMDMMSNLCSIQNLTYKLNQLDQKIDDTMVMTKILTVLPEDYRYFTSAWDSTSTIDRTLENLKARLIQEENKIKSLDSNNERPNESLVFKTSYTQAKGKIKNVKCFSCQKTGHVQKNCPNRKFCSFCKKSNHDDANCYLKNKTSQNKYICTICKKNNHETKNCFFRDKPSSGKNNDPKNTHKTVFLTKVEEEQISQVLETNKGNNLNLYETAFVVDSGCTPNHMTNDSNILSNLKESKRQISVAKKNQSMFSLGIGNIDSEQCILKNVSYVPDLSNNLMSVNAITESGGKVVFTQNKVEVIKNDCVVLEGNKNNQGLYIINLESSIDTKYDFSNGYNCVTNHTGQMVSRKETTTYKSPFNNHQQKNSVNGNEICNQSVACDNKGRGELMEIWHKKLGHLNNESVKKLTKMSIGMPYDLLKCENVFCTICIEAKQTRFPFNSVRERGSKPLHIIHSDVCGQIEPKTHDGKSYFLTCIDDYTHFCKVYLLKTKDEANQYIKEYISEAEAYFNLKTHKIRCDNGGEYVSTNLKQWCKEKGTVLDYTIPHTPQLNGTAERMNRTLLNKARAMLFDTNLKNEMWGEAVLTAAYLLNRSPSVTVDKTPAEKWYGEKPDLSRLQIFGSVGYSKILGRLKKLDRRSIKMIFIGYSLNGYRMWDEEKRKIIISRDVIFEKKNSNYKKICRPDDRQSVNSKELQDESQELEEEKTVLEYVEENLEEQEHLSQEENEQINEEEPELREQRYDLRDRNNIKMPVRYEEYDQNSLLTYNECVHGSEKEKWKTAINKEKDSLKKNKTWEIVDRKETLGKEILSSQWIFKIKDDGTYKARLVVKGCQQKGKIDFKDTFSPVVDSTSLRILLALAAQETMQIQTFDIKTAFLYGQMGEDVYMLIPEGFEEQGQICKLKKSLYGLKQAPCLWNKKFTSFLKNEGMTQLKSDQCIFKNKDNDLYLAIHVDDGILIGKEEITIVNLLKKLENEFEMTISPNPSVYIGMEIKRDKDGILITQEKYAKQVLNRFNMTNCKEVKTPIKLQEISETSNETIKTVFPYREAVGSLLYLANKTRPDLTFSVGYESRHLENPDKNDVQNIKRTLRYLKGTQNHGIHFSSVKQEEIELYAYCDSDFAGDTQDRKSTSGYVIMFAGGPVTWSSRKQPIVALSTAEAEYIAAADCCKELKYLRTLINELTNKQVKITLNIDNQSAMKMIESGQMNRRSKHIDVRYYFISEQFHDGLFTLQYCKSDEQLGDIFTKSLTNPKFQKFKDVLTKSIT